MVFCIGYTFKIGFITVMIYINIREYYLTGQGCGGTFATEKVVTTLAQYSYTFMHLYIYIMYNFVCFS